MSQRKYSLAGKVLFITGAARGIGGAGCSAVGDLKVKRTSKRYLAQLENEMTASLPAGESISSERVAG